MGGQMMPVSATQPSGWRAELSLQFAERAGRTALVRRAHRGPLIVQSPFYPEGPVCHVYVLHPPGGVADGDHLSLEVGAVSDTQSLLTTPAAGKFYRCPDASAVQTVELDVARGASLEWLPQENIFFAGARVSLALKVALEDTARFIGWDINCLGRPSCNEAFDTGRVTNILELRRARLPALLERLSVRPGKPIADAQMGTSGATRHRYAGGDAGEFSDLIVSSVELRCGGRLSRHDVARRRAGVSLPRWRDE